MSVRGKSLRTRFPIGALSVRVAWLLVAVLLLAAVGPRAADRVASAHPLPPEQDITLSQLRLNDLTVYGSQPTLDIWFPGYGDYELGTGSYLYLEYDHSPLIRPDSSTLSVAINGFELSSVPFSEANASRTVWKISLPKTVLYTDVNHLVLTFNVRLGEDDDQCGPGTGALYSTIYRESYIHYEYVRPLSLVPLPVPDLGRFPEPFIRPNVHANERYRLECLRWLRDCQSVLDVGCGTADLLADLRADLRVVGIDMTLGMLAAGAARGCAAVARAEVLPFADESFDGVLSINVLEHLPEPLCVLKEISRVLSVHGRAVLITPAAEWSGLLELAERLRLKLPEGPHRFLGRGELLQSAANANLSTLAYRRILMAPLGGKRFARPLQFVEQWTAQIGTLHLVVVERQA